MPDHPARFGRVPGGKPVSRYRGLRSLVRLTFWREFEDCYTSMVKRIGKAPGGERDPVEAVVQAAREMVLEAIDKGWLGPPYDPFKLAEMRGIAVSPRADIPDARTIPIGQNRLLIEYNPMRPPARLRYSVAHELAHTLFSDCGERIRNRAKEGEGQDDWQLEALCNVAAAEILMPVGSMEREPNDALTIESVLAARRRYEVSTEAVLIRLIHLSEEPCSAFVASRLSEHEGSKYAYDYLIPSRSWKYSIPRGSTLSSSSPVAECTAIGYSAKGRVSITGGQEKLRLECVGIRHIPVKFFARGRFSMQRQTRRPGEPNRVPARGCVEPARKRKKV